MTDATPLCCLCVSNVDTDSPESGTQHLDTGPGREELLPPPHWARRCRDQPVLPMQQSGMRVRAVDQSGCRIQT
jgi:hypothetical protein